MKGRAYRRHHDKRMLQHAKKILRSNNNIDWLNWAVPRFADNLAKCSCDMCCNPRRHKLLTIQEERFKIYEIE